MPQGRVVEVDKWGIWIRVLSPAGSGILKYLL